MVERARTRQPAGGVRGGVAPTAGVTGRRVDPVSAPTRDPVSAPTREPLAAPTREPLAAPGPAVSAHVSPDPAVSAHVSPDPAVSARSRPRSPRPKWSDAWRRWTLVSVRRAGRWAVFPMVVYLASRLLLLAVAAVLAVVGHRTLGGELSVFDGRWFLRLAAQGYPDHVVHVQSTLGFFPLYPLVLLAVAWALSCSHLVAGLVVSFVGGLAATLLVYRIAVAAWSPLATRRAVVAFCLFPGSIVFSLVYSESLLIPLAAGCLLALSRRRWVLAGVLAGCASAVEPIGVVIVAVCAVVCAAQLHRSGWHDRTARHSLASPVLSVTGVGAFAAYLWARTGTPFATLQAQYYGWHQRLDPVAVIGHAVSRLGSRHSAAAHAAVAAATARAAAGSSGFDFNLVNGLGGAAFLAVALVLLVRSRRRLPPGALAWTVGIAVLTVWSIKTPPNARMIISAFPAVTIFADRLAGKGYYVFVAVELALLVAMTGLTITGRMTP